MSLDEQEDDQTSPKWTGKAYPWYEPFLDKFDTIDIIKTGTILDHCYIHSICRLRDAK